MSKISILSSNILKQQKARSDLKIKFDILSEKIKSLEAANIELSDKVTADVISQSPVDNSTESVCSFKTTSSSIHDKNVLKNKSVKPQIVKSNQIKPSNLFYDKSVDGPASFYVKSLGKKSKKNQMVWRVKTPDEEKKNDKSFKSITNAKKNSTHKGKSFDNSDIYYSTNHLIRIAQRKICCFYCGENDFVQQESAHNWYGSYRITSQISDFKRYKSNERWILKSNIPGPKYQWVPKPVKSVSQRFVLLIDKENKFQLIFRRTGRTYAKQKKIKRKVQLCAPQVKRKLHFALLKEKCKAQTLRLSSQT
ncbi:hypothetical protein L6452_06049 [Arctium lappa]|uniref:Uncharacterized protein n=1 Tax=Arctium lappa TaxID=4217 RepID=A0ACB9EIC2_ARCLA|nr:hypothetical protein L6452_06049 [Arctium lappa]